MSLHVRKEFKRFDYDQNGDFNSRKRNGKNIMSSKDRIEEMVMKIGRRRVVGLVSNRYHIRL